MAAYSGGCVIRARARLNLSAVVGSDRIFGQNRHFSFKTRLEGTLSSQVGRYLVGLVVATPSLFPHLVDHAGHTDDSDDPHKIVGEHVPRHLGADVLQRSHLEVCCAHPGFDCAERVLDRFAA